MTEQRLIDAGKLIEKAYWHGDTPSYGELYPEGHDAVDVEDIENAPTVEAVQVVHGHWLKALGSMPPEVFGRHVCSVCDHFAPNDFHGKHEFLSPICPYCGSKMNEGGENDG